MSSRPDPHESKRHSWRCRRTLVALVVASPLFSVGCGDSVPPAPRLAVLISVDTLRADRIGANGSPLGLTPNLDAFATQSHHFTTAYAPSSFTLPSVGALLTGRYPEEIALVNNRSALSDSVPTLASVFRQRGWRTGAVVSNFVLRRNSGLAAGFDEFDDAMPQREIVRDWPERTAEDTTDAFLKLLDSLIDQPHAKCFAWVHYQDPHGPYTPPEGYRDRYLPAERKAADGTRRLPQRTGRGGRSALPSYQEIAGRREVAFYRAGYHGEIAYLDKEIGRLLDGIDQRGLRDRSIVAFTADHGEALGERDYWFAHGERLTDPLVRVPLMIRAPGFAPERRHDIATLIDLLPTLLALTGQRAPDARGRNLMLPARERRDSIVYLATLDGATRERYGWVEGPYKLIVTPSDGTTELYRRDAGGVERIADETGVVDQLAARLDAFRAALPRGAVEIRQKLGPADRERLRTLGYAEPDRDRD